MVSLCLPLQIFHKNAFSVKDSKNRYPDRNIKIQERVCTISYCNALDPDIPKCNFLDAKPIPLYQRE